MLGKLQTLALRAKVTMVSAIVLCCCLPTMAQALNFDQISQVYFFGDSLTDSGFNDIWAIVPSDKAPTFTTIGGYTWAQYIARDIKGFTLPVYPGPSPADTITNNAGFPFDSTVSGTKHGIDYAAAGSTTNSTGNGEFWAPSLHQQINYYLSTQTVDPNAVYFIWEGANDLLVLLEQTNPPPTELQLLIAANTAAVNIANEVALLSARGAKRFVILSLPNIGWTPAITLQNNPSLPGMVKTVTFTFNSMLNQQLGGVIAQYHVKVLYEDVYTLLDNVIIDTKAGQPYVIAGQSFLFTNYADPLCSPETYPYGAIMCPLSQDGYIFADSLHPTGMAHRLLSLVVEQDILNWN